MSRIRDTYHFSQMVMMVMMMITVMIEAVYEIISVADS